MLALVVFASSYYVLFCGTGSARDSDPKQGSAAGKPPGATKEATSSQSACDLASDDGTDEAFGRASAFVAAQPKGSFAVPEQLKLYALYKQYTVDPLILCARRFPVLLARVHPS